MSERTLKIALLGAGGRGRAVIRNWITLGRCQLGAVVDPSQDSLDRTRKALGDLGKDALYTRDVQGWLKKADCDLVTINSWDPQHAQNAIDCFEAGLNVQVAKPMTQTTADADRVYLAWKKSGKLGVVDMQLRCSELVKTAMNVIRSGRLGTIRLISCFDYVGRSGVEFRYQRSRRRDMIQSWTLAKGVHFLDMLNGFMDDHPVRVFASGGRAVFGGDKPNDLTCDRCEERTTCDYEGSKTLIGGIPYPNPKSGCVFARETDVNDHLVATIDYQRGGRASYTECYFTPEYQTLYDIIGDKGAMQVRYGMDNRHFIQVRQRTSPRLEHIPIYAQGAHGGGDDAIILAIVDALRTGKPMKPDILDGRMSVALCQALDQSVECRMPVEIPPLPN